VLEVLAYLHRQGVVHRDVKPSNLLFDGEGRLKLADLGLARPVGELAGLTSTGVAPGTLAYMSLEQAYGGEAGPPADLYSLGVTLDAGRAVGLAEEAMRELDRRARTDVEALVWHGLAERVLGDAILAAGDRAAADIHLRHAHDLAQRRWFGRAAR
jgi:hypothetical protein